jgi:hypothetical protein
LLALSAIPQCQGWSCHPSIPGTPILGQGYHDLIADHYVEAYIIGSLVDWPYIRVADQRANAVSQRTLGQERTYGEESLTVWGRHQLKLRELPNSRLIADSHVASHEIGLRRVDDLAALYAVAGRSVVHKRRRHKEI